MSSKIKKQTQQTAPMTDTQKHIKELRARLNAPDPNEIHPFTLYKIITYLCVLILPLVPVALYRIWRPATEFSRREQLIWTAVIGVIGVYAVCIGMA